MDFESVKEWYNGYLIDEMHMYNPNSVYRAMVTKKLSSYLSRALSEVSHELSASHTDALDEVFHEFSASCWKNTSAFDTINTYITLNFAGLKENILTMLAGGRVSVNVNTFQNDLSVIGSKDEALTALIHLGYLGYDAGMEEAYIPNYEVGLAYQAALYTGECEKIQIWY